MMRNRILLYALAVLIFALGSGPGFAQEPQKGGLIKLGVLDFAQVVRHTKMGKDIARQTAALERSYISQRNKATNELKKASEELQRKQLSMEASALQQEERKFNQRRFQFDRQLQASRQKNARILAKAESDLTRAMQRAITTLANKQGFTLILRRSQMFLRADFLDVTPAVIQIMDKNTPSYKLPTLPARKPRAKGAKGAKAGK